jgi:hypothetical protein
VLVPPKNGVSPVGNAACHSGRKVLNYKKNLKNFCDFVLLYIFAHVKVGLVEAHNRYYTLKNNVVDIKNNICKIRCLVKNIAKNSNKNRRKAKETTSQLTTRTNTNE